MLPGLGPISAIALMIPITYGFDPASGMILMAGVYYGAIFGGSTSSILVNAPGVAGTVATSFDGYPMAQQGKAGKALAIAAIASFAGGTIAAVMLMLAAPALAEVSLSFQSPDYLMLMILGLTAVSAFASRGKYRASADCDGHRTDVVDGGNRSLRGYSAIHLSAAWTWSMASASCYLPWLPSHLSEALMSVLKGEPGQQRGRYRQGSDRESQDREE